MAEEEDPRWATVGRSAQQAPAPAPVPASAPAGDDPRWATIGTQKQPAAGDIDPLTGQKYQFASSGGSSPVAQSTGRPIREDLVPGAGIQAAGSLGSDPEQRRRIMAKQLFPGMSDADAQSRLFYGPNGRLAAVGFNGQAFYVDPAPYAPDINRPSTLIPRDAWAHVGTAAGPALPATGAVVGGLAGGPTSIVLGPTGAAVGAASGDVVRQRLAAQLDPGAPPYNPYQTATEAAGAGVGQLVGGLAVRAGMPNPLAASSRDVAALRGTKLAPSVLPDAEAALLKARAQGVELTPGQASGLPSVLNLEDAVASGAAVRAGANPDIAKTYYDMQRQQLAQAHENALARVSPVTDKTDAALQFQQGAEDATRIARQQANATARPSYQAAEKGGQVMSPDLAQLMEAPAVKSALESARKEYQNIYRKPAPETPDFALWDLAKRKLDDAHNVATRAGERTTAHAIDTLRGDLLTHLDAAYPTYGTAREAAAPGQRLATRMEDVLGTRGAPDLGTDKARAIVKPVFDTNNPRAIAEAKDAFTAAGRADEWNAGVRAHLQDLFDQAGKSQEGLNPQMLLRQVWADKDRRLALQAAMDPAAFQGLENFMETLQHVARSRGMNSLTEPRRAAVNALEESAASTPGVKAVGALGSVAGARGGIPLLGIPGDVMRGIQNWMTARNVARVSERLFSPEGIEYLRAMAKTPGGSMRALTATARFLGERGGAAVAPSGEDRPPNPLAAP